MPTCENDYKHIIQLLEVKGSPFCKGKEETKDKENQKPSTDPDAKMLVLQNGNSTQINEYLKRVKTIADKDYNEKHKEENKEAEKHLVVFIYYSGHGTKEGGDTLICGTDGGLVNIDNEIRGICNKNVTVVAVIDSAREEKKEAKDFPAYK